MVKIILLKRFLFMLQFLTTIPVNISLDVDEKDCGKGLVLAPIIGVLLGLILHAAYFGMSFVLPGAVSAILTIIIYMLLTGGLHLDGLGDTFDGVFSRRPKEQVLEIMKDSRVGTNAVLVLCAVLLLNYSLLQNMDILPSGILIMTPVAGRMALLLAAGSSEYARKQGLGKSFIDYCGWKEILAGLPLYFVIFFLTAGLNGLILSFIPLIIAWVLVKYFSRKIDGVTGDILGAVCELTQTFFLIAALLVYSSTLLS